jgi:hypothetical protein
MIKKKRSLEVDDGERESNESSGGPLEPAYSALRAVWSLCGELLTATTKLTVDNDTGTVPILLLQ